MGDVASGCGGEVLWGRGGGGGASGWCRPTRGTGWACSGREQSCCRCIRVEGSCRRDGARRRCAMQRVGEDGWEWMRRRTKTGTEQARAGRRFECASARHPVRDVGDSCEERAANTATSLSHPSFLSCACNTSKGGTGFAAVLVSGSEMKLQNCTRTWRRWRGSESGLARELGRLCGGSAHLVLFAPSSVCLFRFPGAWGLGPAWDLPGACLETPIENEGKSRDGSSISTAPMPPLFFLLHCFALSPPIPSSYLAKPSRASPEAPLPALPRAFRLVPPYRAPPRNRSMRGTGSSRQIGRTDATPGAGRGPHRMIGSGG